MHPTAELFTEKAWGAVVAAQQLAQQRRQQQMESEHLFAALLAHQGLGSRVLEKAGVDVGNLNQRVEAFIAGQPSLSAAPDNVYLGKGLNAVLDQANELKGSFGDSYIAIEHLLLALAIDDRAFPGIVCDLDYKYDIYISLLTYTPERLEKNPIFYNEVVNKGIYYGSAV